MKILDERKMLSYSAPMDAPCGEGIFVWRNFEHPNQDQMKDHLKECEKCQEIIRNYKSIEEAKWYMRGYIEKYMKNEI